MKRWIHASEDYYTSIITEDLPEEVNVFMNTFDDELDLETVKDAVDAFFDEYKLFPPSNSMDSLDMKYDDDKGRFYKKYRPFADRCKALAKVINPSGYGRNDFFKLKMRDAFKAVDYNFPYGWKHMVRG